MRARAEIEEDPRGGERIIVTELPFMVNKSRLVEHIAQLVREKKLPDIRDLRDESDREGLRVVIELKRDAIPHIVLNRLYKHTQMQSTFGTILLALVDGVPRTLPLDAFVRHWISHQITVIQRRTAYRLRVAEERAHILRGLLKAIDQIDAVIALIRASSSAAEAQGGLMELLDIDEIQAQAILDMQLRKLAALERTELQTRYDGLMRDIAEYQAILASEERQRTIVGDELADIVTKFGDERRTVIVPDEGEVTDEDLIAERDLVVTLPRGG